MLEFQNVSYQYPSEDFDIIDHLSFAVEPGSFHCIIGISGCGKSTIFRMTNGLLKPKAGTILVEGSPLWDASTTAAICPRRTCCSPGEPWEKMWRRPWRSRGADPCGAPGPGGGGAGRRGTCRLRQQDARRALWRDAAAGGLCPHHADGLRPAAAGRALLRPGLPHPDLHAGVVAGPVAAAQEDHPLHHPRRGGGAVPLLQRAGGGAHPIRELAEIPVPASFPRDRSCLKLPEMVELKEHLIDLLRKQVTP